MANLSPSNKSADVTLSLARRVGDSMIDRLLAAVKRARPAPGVYVTSNTGNDWHIDHMANK